MIRVKVGEKYRLKLSFWDKLWGKRQDIFTVVKDYKGHFWFRDFNTIYPGGTGLWCGKIGWYDLSKWEKVII